MGQVIGGIVAGARAAGRGMLARVRGGGWRRWARRAALCFALLVVSIVGVWGGLLLGGHTHDDVGPFAARFQISPTLSGGTSVQIPPLGSLDLATHTGPAHLTVTLDSLDQKRTLALATDPNGIEKASAGAVDDVERGVIRVLFISAGAGILATVLLAGLIFRNMRRVAVCGGLAVLIMAASGGIALGTFQPSSVEEPRYHGLLSNAPAVIGDAKRIANQYSAYQDELQQLVNNVSRLYGTFSNLPVYQPTPGTVRVLHVSDIHLNPAAWSVVATVVKQYDINLVIDTGDINDWGTQVETSFVDSIGSLAVPYVYIRGNHDSAVTASAVAGQPNATVLENQVTTVDGLTIAGIGDPRFTPDKDAAGNVGASAHQIADLLDTSGERLATTIQRYGKPVDIALVHDPASSGPLDGLVPLVLAGHLHARQVSVLPAVPDRPATRLMVEGSTGGAGLRGLEGKTPTPLEMSVLYFDAQHALQAYDEISLGGTGQTEVTIDRHLVQNPQPSGSPSTSPSGSPSTSPGGSPAPSPTR